MPNAIILSLGMLKQSVNIGAFSGKMIALAKAKDSNFDPKKLLPCYALAAEFNKNKITKESFMQSILTMLNIEMNASDFWETWNEIVTFGDMAKTINALKTELPDNLFYLNTDTNLVHLERFFSYCRTENIQLNTDLSPKTIEHFPLYASCDYGLDRFDLVKKIVVDIQAKTFNKPKKTILVLGDPQNIADLNSRAKAEAETKMIQDWAAQNNVEIVLHLNALQIVDTVKNHLLSTPSAAFTM